MSRFSEISLAAGSAPESIVAGPQGDNHLWFTEDGTDMIGRIDNNGIVDGQFQAIGQNPANIIADSINQSIWYSATLASGDTGIFEMNLDGGVIYQCDVGQATIVALAPSPDGQFVWFSDGGLHRLSLKDCFVADFPLQSANEVYGLPLSEGHGITAGDIAFGPKGNLWLAGGVSGFYQFTYDGGYQGSERLNNALLGYITPPEQSASPEDAYPQLADIELRPSEPLGKLAFDSGDNVVFSGSAYDIIAGPKLLDGTHDLWSTDSSSPIEKLDCITPAGQNTEIALPTSDGVVQDITLGPDGNIWFVEPGTDQIGRFNITNQELKPSVIVINSSGIDVTQRDPSGNISQDSSGNERATLNPEEPFRLDAIGTLDPYLEDNVYLTYSWAISTDPSMSGATTSSGQNLDWIFAEPGPHYVTLTVTDPTGAKETIELTITDNSGSPSVNMAPAVAVGLPPSVAIDSTFGPDGQGRVLTNVADQTTGQPTNDSTIATAIGTDGELFVLAQVNSQDGSSSQAHVFQYDQNGNLVESYVPWANLDPVTPLYLATQTMPDGTIDVVVAAMDANGQLMVERYNEAGSPDQAFDTNAATALMGFLAYQPYYSPITRGLVVQPDGKILIGGGLIDNTAQLNEPITLLRLKADGTLDTTGFGTGGVVTEQLGYQNVAAESIAVQTDGKIVVGASGGVLARFYSDGSLDTSFGSGGTVVTADAITADSFGGSPVTVLIRPQGQIVVVGTLSQFNIDWPSGLALVQYTTDGSLDTSYGTGGTVALVGPANTGNYGPWQPAYGLTAALEADGSIILACKIFDWNLGPIDFSPLSSIDGLVRLTPNGQLDPGFGADGALITDFGGSGLEMAAAPGGRIVLADTDQYPQSVALARFVTASASCEVVAGQELSFALTATDPNPNDQAGAFTYTIDWGDGTRNLDGSLPTATGPAFLPLEHVYAPVSTDTTYTILVTATDQDGNQSQQYSLTVTVSPLTGSGLQNVVDGVLPTDPVTNLPAATFAATTDSDVTDVLNAASALPAQSEPVAIVLDLQGGTYNTDLAPTLSANVTLVINGASSSPTIIVGHSPALTVSSGNVVISGVTFVTSTNATTILVTGGQLTLRIDTVEESTGYSQAAISITGGTVDLGTAIDLGGNTINVNGTGEFVHNTTPNVVPATGDTFEVNANPLSAASLSFTSETSSIGNAILGQPVTFKATVQADGLGTPTGCVDFFDATTNTDLGSAVLSGGSAALTTSALTVGNHIIWASYSGDANFLLSQDATSVTAIPPSSLSGTVFTDFNDDGRIDFGEGGIANVAIALTGTDDLGHSVCLCQTTNGDGAYVFLNLRPGNYQITETQPAGYPQGIDTVGTAGGSLVATDQFFVQLAQDVDGLNYNFGEQPPTTGAVKKGQAAGIGFWNNKNGQALILALNGGIGHQLGDWLAATMPNTFGASAGSNNLTCKSNAYVAALFQKDFVMQGVKLDAQVLATALSVYVTDSTLDSTGIATHYGFTVSGTGLGTDTVNVGSSGDAFGVANNTVMTVLDLLVAADEQAVNGVLYNGNVTKRNEANDLFSALNQAGGI
ncbi:MAG TPA: Ig-like domain repeat protein [Gemmataceae bacterium]|jgi:uncharacterized delta-60 repeat protein|nr:Ig-like domain repeat protein [Gemmataceae bacterium]